jgi:putative ABC transport system permease protein
MRGFSLRRLIRQPAHTIAALTGVALAVALIASISAFIDGSTGLMTTRALAPISVDMHLVLNTPLSTSSPLLTALRTQVGGTPGVTASAAVAAVDLGAGALSVAGTPLAGTTQLFAFDPAYIKDFGLVRITSGTYPAGGTLLSTQAADALGIRPGGQVVVRLPGGTALTRIVTGVADFRSAAPLFASRNPDTQGEITYVPNVVVIDQAGFATAVLPALRADAASSAPALRTVPVLEVQVRADRTRYVALAPAEALVRAQALRRTIERIAPGDAHVVDNVSGALTAAQRDSVLARVLFLFLGTPGVLLGAYLARYAASLLAESERRELATLRARGAGPRHLRQSLLVETLALGVFGALSGLLVAALLLTAVFGGPLPPGSTTQTIALSIGLAILAGLVTTAVALYLPRRLALDREIAAERGELAAQPRDPLWARARLDLIFIVLSAVIEGVTLLGGGFRPTAAEGQSLSLSFYTLLAPVFLWIGLTLLLVRFVLAGLRRRAARPARSFGPVVGGLARRALARRTGPFAAGLIALALAVAFGTSLALFISTYDAHQRSDARLVVGGDVRVTPGSTSPHALADTAWLSLPGVAEVTGVVSVPDALVGNDKRALIGIDPQGFTRVAAPPDAFFPDGGAAAALDALRADPSAVLISDELARTFNILPGDTVAIRLPRADGTLVPVTFRAVALFATIPAFPQGIDLVANRDAVSQAIGRATADLYLLRTQSDSLAALAAVGAELRALPDASALTIQTTAEAYNQDQSTLAALNLAGLGRIVAVASALMSAAAAAVFVTTLIAARRKEFITLRALGLRAAELRLLLASEGLLLVALGLAVGIVVGVAMAAMDIQILAPLFVVPPKVPDPALGGVASLAALVLGGALLAIGAGAISVARLRPTEILREE